MTPRGRDVALAVAIVSSPAVLWPLGLLPWVAVLALVLAVVLALRERRRRVEVERLRRRLGLPELAEIER